MRVFSGQRTKLVTAWRYARQTFLVSLMLSLPSLQQAWRFLAIALFAALSVGATRAQGKRDAPPPDQVVLHVVGTVDGKALVVPADKNSVIVLYLVPGTRSDNAIASRDWRIDLSAT